MSQENVKMEKSSITKQSISPKKTNNLDSEVS